ncbi:LysR family transcriptional regulator [Domibacillus sp. DTU_2020_1001157_1_SI_ALB_TIR_016]|uniref:LysR family transcriptional regulator n=1 Tax=Domibacillus sp. DTU_2020_1001157_1_SI_ALB_TIR_016 TaxID=3077789 RepID=UPI0028E2FACB|nr:LysR family transcriptional regulator [Domibacillus sp. DTU_2020_1001157_1_SI_ALB_TIR_016]WNS80440.1 LysR family transcriptional regulator [Domibacillus sp. DTU_2020_1001157_1_SI_ALB_TIR_016]
MEWHQIENAAAVAHTRNFTRAAKKQAISQPALSRSIMKLEEELGAPLFLRGKKEVQLTQAGVIFVQKAQQALQLMKEAKEDIQEIVSPDKGHVSIAFLPTFGPHVLPNLIAEYKRIYPNVTFQLSQGAGEVNMKKVQEEEADLCITAPPYKRHDIEWTVVREEQLYITVPASHPFAKRPYLSFREAAAEPFVTFKKGFGLRFMFDEMCEKLGIEPQITFEGEEVPTIAGFVAAGLGLCVLPKKPEIAHEPLAFIEISDYSLVRKIAIGVKKRGALSPAARQFKTFAEKYLQQNHGGQV